MSDLILLFYRSQSVAFAAGEALAVLQREAGTEPEDIVVVTRDATGRVSVNQSVDLETGRPVGDGRWGALIGMMFLDRRPAKAGGRGLAAQFREAGLEAEFLQAADETLAGNGAVVGMRVRLLGRDRVLARIATLKGTPKILQTRLGAAAEDALQDLQAQIPGQVLDHSALDGFL